MSRAPLPLPLADLAAEEAAELDALAEREARAWHGGQPSPSEAGAALGADLDAEAAAFRARASAVLARINT